MGLNKLAATYLILMVVTMGLSGCQGELISVPAGTTLAENAQKVPRSLDPSDSFHAAYYSEVDLKKIPASIICLGSSFFGQAGAAICQTGSALTPASSSDVLAGKEYWNELGVKVTGTGSIEVHLDCTVSGSKDCIATSSFLAGAPKDSFAGADGVRSIAIPQGYYDGTKTVTVNDANLSSGNIVSGVNLLGVTGSAVVEAHSACTDNALNSKACATANSRYVTNSAGSNVMELVGH